MDDRVFPIAPGSRAGARGFAVLAGLLVAAPVVVVAVAMLWPGRVTLTVSADGVRVDGSTYGRLIPAGSIDAAGARRVSPAADPGAFPARRTNGVGLPNYQAGHFTLHDGRPALVFLTDPSRAVLVPTTAVGPLLVSPADPDAFLAALRAPGPAPAVFSLAPAPRLSAAADPTFWAVALAGPALAVALMALLAFRSRGVVFELSDRALRIRGSLYGRDIPRSSLRADEARVTDLRADPAFRWMIRTSGVGLPNYLAGWFRSKGVGSALLFVTDRARVVVVPTLDGYTLVVSPADPDSFLTALRAHAPAR